MRLNIWPNNLFFPNCPSLNVKGCRSEKCNSPALWSTGTYGSFNGSVTPSVPPTMDGSLLAHLQVHRQAVADQQAQPREVPKEFQNNLHIFCKFELHDLMSVVFTTSMLDVDVDCAILVARRFESTGELFCNIFCPNTFAQLLKQRTYTHLSGAGSFVYLPILML